MVATRLFCQESYGSFRWQYFSAACGNLGGKIPIVDDVVSAHEQKIYPTNSSDDNSIKFEFCTDGNCYVDWRKVFLALILKMVQGCADGFYDPEYPENEKDDSKEDAAEVTADEEKEKDRPVPPVTHLNKYQHSIFSNVEVYINNQ